MRKPVVVFNGISKHYPLYHHIAIGVKNLFCNFRKSINTARSSKFEALHEISFEIYKGETFGIIGINGAGKSTMLGLMAGVLKPSSGSLTVNGRISPLLELGAGFHPELTGRENILLNGVIMGLTRAQILEKTPQIIEFSELGEFIEEPVRIYSSGMLARLGFSVAAHLEPDILLIDETLSVGDIGFQKKCLKKISAFKNNGVTIVFVSHDLETVSNICDRVLWLDNQRIMFIGQTDETVSMYRDHSPFETSVENGRQTI